MAIPVLLPRNGRIKNGNRLLDYCRKRAVRCKQEHDSYTGDYPKSEPNGKWILTRGSLLYLQIVDFVTIKSVSLQLDFRFESLSNINNL